MNLKKLKKNTKRRQLNLLFQFYTGYHHKIHISTTQHAIMTMIRKNTKIDFMRTLNLHNELSSSYKCIT